MIMPHVVRLLLDSYGFKGTILIMGGLALNGVYVNKANCQYKLSVKSTQSLTGGRCFIVSTSKAAFAARKRQIE